MGLFEALSCEAPKRSLCNDPSRSGDSIEPSKGHGSAHLRSRSSHRRRHCRPITSLAALLTPIHHQLSLLAVEFECVSSNDSGSYALRIRRSEQLSCIFGSIPSLFLDHRHRSPPGRLLIMSAGSSLYRRLLYGSTDCSQSVKLSPRTSVHPCALSD